MGSREYFLQCGHSSSQFVGPVFTIATLAIGGVEDAHRHRDILARVATPTSTMRRHARSRTRSGLLHRCFKFRRRLLRERGSCLATQSRRRRFPGRRPSQRRHNAVSRKRLRNAEATEITNIRMQKCSRARVSNTTREHFLRPRSHLFYQIFNI